MKRLIAAWAVGAVAFHVVLFTGAAVVARVMLRTGAVVPTWWLLVVPALVTALVVVSVAGPGEREAPWSRALAAAAVPAGVASGVAVLAQVWVARRAEMDLSVSVVDVLGPVIVLLVSSVVTAAVLYRRPRARTS